MWKFFSETFGFGTDLVVAGRNGVGIGTDFINNRAAVFKVTDRDRCLADAAIELSAIEAELDGDAKAAVHHAALKSKLGW